MSIRLPDHFHAAGVLALRVGGAVKVCMADKVTVRVTKLRVPAEIAGRYEQGVLLGAWMGAEVGQIRALVSGRLIKGSGDWFRYNEAEFQKLVEQVDAPFTKAGIVMPVNVAGKPTRSALPEIYKKTLVSGEDAGRVRHEIEQRKAAERQEKEREKEERKRREANKAKATTHRTAKKRKGQREPSRAPRTRAKKTKVYVGSHKPINPSNLKPRRGKQKHTGPRRRATAKQYRALVASGATVNVDVDHFRWHITMEQATSAISTQNAGVHQVIVNPAVVRDQKAGPLSKAESQQLLASVRS